MKGRSFGVLALCSILGLCVGLPLAAQSEEVQRVDNSIEVFRAIAGVAEKEGAGVHDETRAGHCHFPARAACGFRRRAAGGAWTARDKGAGREFGGIPCS